MNELTNITGNGPATMSSMEIAELCEKRHDHVMRDIRVMLEALGEGLPKFGGTYADVQGKKQNCFNLPRDLTMTLITGYSIPLRKKVIDRLDELEQKVASPPDLFDPTLLRGLLLQNVEKVIALEARVGEMQQDVDALHHLTEANGSLNRTEAAKNLGVPPQILIRWMKTNGWTYRRAGSKEDLAYQSKIIAGYLEHKVTAGPRPDGTEWISTQVRVTAKGLTALAKAFPVSARAA